PLCAITERAVVGRAGGRGTVGGHRAAGTVELVVKEQAGFVADQRRAETGLNLRLRADGIPDPKLIEPAVEEIAAEAPNAQFVAATHKWRHAHLARCEHAIGVDAHGIAALAGHER